MDEGKLISIQWSLPEILAKFEKLQKGHYEHSFIEPMFAAILAVHLHVLLILNTSDILQTPYRNSTKTGEHRNSGTTGHYCMGKRENTFRERNNND